MVVCIVNVRVDENQLFVMEVTLMLSWVMAAEVEMVTSKMVWEFWKHPRVTEGVRE